MTDSLFNGMRLFAQLVLALQACIYNNTSTSHCHKHVDQIVLQYFCGSYAYLLSHLIAIRYILAI